MARSSLWDMSLPGFDKCTQAERKKSVGWMFSLWSADGRAALRPFLRRVAYRTSHVHIYTHRHTCVRSCTAPTTCRTALTLLLLVAPAYGYGSIIARHTETHLEAFARRERATISFYLSPHAAPLPLLTWRRIGDSQSWLMTRSGTTPVSSTNVSRICSMRWWKFASNIFMMKMDRPSVVSLFLNAKQ